MRDREGKEPGERDRSAGKEPGALHARGGDRPVEREEVASMPPIERRMEIPKAIPPTIGKVSILSGSLPTVEAPRITANAMRSASAGESSFISRT